jgi:hypothetical protein
MKTTQLYAIAGIIGMFGAVLNVVAEFLPESLGLAGNLLVNLLLPTVITALYLYQRQATGIIGLIGYAAQVFGLGLIAGFFFAQAFVLSVLDPTVEQQLLAGTLGLVVVSTLVILALGIVLFGLATFRARVFPRWATVLYVVFFLVALGARFLPGPVGLAAEFGISIAIIRLCYTLLGRDNLQRQTRNGI